MSVLCEPLSPWPRVAALSPLLFVSHAAQAPQTLQVTTICCCVYWECYSLATEHLASALGSSNAGHLLCSVAWLDPGKPGEVCQPAQCLINFGFLDSVDLSVWKVKKELREINGILLGPQG